MALIMRIDRPLHQFESLQLKHVIDELVESGADRSILALNGTQGDEVAAVVVIRGLDTRRYLDALEGANQVVERQQVIDAETVLDICNAYESGYGHAGRQLPNPWPVGTPEHAAYIYGKQQALQRKSS